MFFGGRSEAVANNIDVFKKLFPKKAVYFLNYRGYAGSSGEPTEKNIYNDAKFLYEEVSKKHKKISVIGRSLGTGVATKIASSFDIDKLVLVTPYDSILNMAMDKYPFYPISYILKDKYDSLSRAKNISASTLIILASLDETIPFKYSDNLIKEFNPSILKVKTISNSGHKSIVDKEEYYLELKKFFNE